MGINLKSTHRRPTLYHIRSRKDVWDSGAVQVLYAQNVLIIQSVVLKGFLFTNYYPIGMLGVCV